MIDLTGLEYKTYSNREIASDNDKLLKLSEEEVKIIYVEWQEIEKYNNEILKKRTEIYCKISDEIREILQKYGIGVYKNLGRPKKYYNWYLTNICDPIRRKVLPNYQYIPTIYNYNDIIQKYRKLEKETNVHKRQKELEQQQLELALKYIKEHDVNVEGMTDIVTQVTEIAKNEWFEKNYKIGDIIDIKCCSKCDEYTIGERRCSCGNRRIDYYVEGDLLNEFYLETAAY